MKFYRKAFPVIYRRAALMLALQFISPLMAEDVGSRWGTENRERDFYRLVDIPIPEQLVIEAGAFEWLPGNRLAIGTRHGDIFVAEGIDAEKPLPSFHLFASGLDEIFGINYREDESAFYVTQSCELTRISDTDEDGRADRFETVSDAWGYANYHEYAFGSDFDSNGNMYIALGLSNSYHSRALFRGWVLQVTPDGSTVPFASGLRSPGGIGFNEHDSLFYIESQGPWNSSCSLKSVTRGSFHGHPVSFNWYPYAPNLGPAPSEPVPRTRIIDEAERIEELTPYAVIFPYIRMGRSITGFTINRTEGKFGPFENQIFLGDYTQSIVMRATTEKVNGVWQGACYPFREGLSTGILNVAFTPAGHLITGGTNRGWPVRGIRPYALERIDWTGRTPFEIQQITIAPNGFNIRFTAPVDPETGSEPGNYHITTFTHIYHGAYGGPEVDRTEPQTKQVRLSPDGLTATITLDQLTRGHVHEFDLSSVTDRNGGTLLHHQAFYTVNEIPR